MIRYLSATSIDHEVAVASSVANHIGALWPLTELDFVNALHADLRDVNSLARPANALCFALN